jgi:psiF repeat
MKLAVALAALALLSSGVLFAANSPPPATTATPSGASATPVKSLKACNKQADTRNLTGQQRATFVRNCRGGKPPHS